MDPFDAQAVAFMTEIEAALPDFPKAQREHLTARLAIRMRAAFAEANRLQALAPTNQSTEES